MARTSSKVIVDKQFHRWDAQVEAGVKRALTRAGDVCASTARTAETRRQTGKLAGSIKPTAPRTNRRGNIEVSVTMEWYGLFQELGTLGRRRRKLKKRSRPVPRRGTRAPGTGVKPLYFMSKGARAARERLLDLLRQELSR